TRTIAGPADPTADPAADPTDPETTPEPEDELETLYPAPADAARTFPEPLASARDDETGDELTVTGVRRLAEDRVVVTGHLTLEPRPNADFLITTFEEPGYRDLSNGGELAGLRLTVD